MTRLKETIRSTTTSVTSSYIYHHCAQIDDLLFFIFPVVQNFRLTQILTSPIQEAGTTNKQVYLVFSCCFRACFLSIDSAGLKRRKAILTM